METSNLNKQLKAIDKAIEDFKSDIERGKALTRLMANQDFKDVILDGYFEAEANKLFNILVDPTGASPYSNEEIQLKLAAISHFKSYVGTTDFRGTIEMDAERAPSLLMGEEAYRNEVTADFAASGE